MSGWWEYAAAFAVFFLSHAVPVRPAIKTRVVAAIGARGFSWVYSALSVAVLAWLIIAAGRAPVVMLWDLPGWAHDITLAMMLAATLLFTLAIGRPNPLSFGGTGNASFDPGQPGIVGWVRHPLLWVLMLWSAGHLPVNGDMAHAIMFGAFAVFSVIGMHLIDRRKRRGLGAQEWQRLAAVRRGGVTVTGTGMVRLSAGVVLYTLVIWLHGPVIGAYPLG